MPEDIGAVATTEIATTEPAPVESFHATHSLVAVNATELATAKQGVRDFIRVKLSSLQLERQEIGDALEEAQRHKWKTATYKSVLKRLDNRILYYGKILCACDAGFTIVPNMEVSAIAVRRLDLSDNSWNSKTGSSTAGFRSASPRIPEESERHLPVGEGVYVSPEPAVTSDNETSTNAKNEKVYSVTHWTDGFQDIDFPLAIANPLVMSATAAAMEKKIFDKIGVVPRTARSLRGDPIVLGQITLKEGYSTKVASFLIAWYLDPRTL